MSKVPPITAPAHMRPMDPLLKGRSSNMAWSWCSSSTQRKKGKKEKSEKEEKEDG